MMLPKKTNFYQRKVLKILIFNILYFLKMCPIFVGSVRDFGKSADKMI
jgi:hypothetical protein